MSMRAKPRSFSKTLLLQESVLIWLLTLAFIALAFLHVVLRALLHHEAVIRAA